MEPFVFLAKAARRKMEKMDGARLAEQSPAPQVHQINNLPYINDGDPFHLLDIYYPAQTRKPLPVLVDIHGGALVYGTKDLNKNYATTLASYGFTVISLSYRLAPEVGFDAQLRDILAAFRWIAQNGGQYPCAMEQLYLTGDSAGALLSVYGAMANESPRLQTLFEAPGSPLRFSALGLVSGLYFTTGNTLESRLQPLIFGRDYKHRCPYYPAMKLEELEEVKKLPPCYLVTSDEDMLKRQTVRFSALLEKRDVPQRFTNFSKREGKKLEHVFSIAYPNERESRITMEEMLAFFRRQAPVSKAERLLTVEEYS